MDPKPYFGEGWEDRVYEKFHSIFSDSVIVYYISHLRWELLSAAEPWRLAAGNVA